MTRGPYRRRYREPGWLPLIERILTGTSAAETMTALKQQDDTP